MPKKPSFKNFLKAKKQIETDPDLQGRFDSNKDGTLDHNELELGAAQLGRKLQKESESEPRTAQTPEVSLGIEKKRFNIYPVLAVAFLIVFALPILFPESINFFSIFSISFGAICLIVAIEGIICGEIEPVGYYGRKAKRSKEPFGYWISVLTWGGMGGSVLYVWLTRHF